MCKIKYMTKAVKYILIINIIIYIISYKLYDDFLMNFVLYPISNENFHFYQLISYSFLHASTVHIVSNMFILLIIGPKVEKEYGFKKFIIIYLISSIFAGLSHSVFMNSPVVGASGAIWALMAIYGLTFSNDFFNFFLLVKIKVKYIIVFLFLMEVFSVFKLDGISHISHIGGVITGSLFYFLNKLKN